MWFLFVATHAYGKSQQRGQSIWDFSSPLFVSGHKGFHVKKTNYRMHGRAHLHVQTRGGRGRTFCWHFTAGNTCVTECKQRWFWKIRWHGARVSKVLLMWLSLANPRELSFLFIDFHPERLAQRWNPNPRTLMPCCALSSLSVCLRMSQQAARVSPLVHVLDHKF